MYSSEAEEQLCNAIVTKAAEDLRDALKLLKYDPENQAMIDMKDECERFFRSQWYERLTEVDGEYLLRKLHEEVEDL